MKNTEIKTEIINTLIKCGDFLQKLSSTEQDISQINFFRQDGKDNTSFEAIIDNATVENIKTVGGMSLVSNNIINPNARIRFKLTETFNSEQSELKIKTTIREHFSEKEEYEKFKNMSVEPIFSHTYGDLNSLSNRYLENITRISDFLSWYSQECEQNHSQKQVEQENKQSIEEMANS